MMGSADGPAVGVRERGVGGTQTVGLSHWEEGAGSRKAGWLGAHFWTPSWDIRSVGGPLGLGFGEPGGLGGISRAGVWREERTGDMESREMRGNSSGGSEQGSWERGQ